MSAYERYLLDGTVPSLRERYQEDFKIGVDVTPDLLRQADVAELVCKHFNSLTCENEMKPDFVMDRAATLRQGDPERVALNFS